MGGNINFGSRTEFLPGDGNNELDIKYQRYGGCFVTYKKGFLYLLASFILAAVVGYSVYHYFSCKKHNEKIYDSAEDILSELLKTAEQFNSSEDETNEISKLSSDINPLYYRLRIQPYLNENGQKNFTFEGHVAIVFQINSSPTDTIILNAKKITIPNSDVSITFSSTSKIEPLKAESQIKEEANSTSDNPEEISSSLNSTIAEENNKNDSLATDTELITELYPENNSNDTVLNEETISNNEDMDPVSEAPLNSTSEPSVSSTDGTVFMVAENNNVQIESQDYNEEDGTYKIKSKLPLEKNVNYTLVMKFTGKMSDKSEGILRSSYIQGDDKIWLASTILKPSFARTVFPCFDEPKFKSRFEISIARRTNMSVVSNMPLKDTYPVENSKGWVWDHFEISPLMSTHSVGFAVFAFNSTKSQAAVPIPLTKLWGRTATINNASYILNIVPKIIKSYNSLFEYNYSLHKIDLVAVPNLPVTSVGSWGLIFFRENDLFVTDSSSSFEDKENLLNLVSRELAQQWLGHVISVQSWGDSWFIESISSYCHYIAMNMMEPSWNILDKTPIIDAQNVLDIDSNDLLPKVSTISPNIDNDHNQNKLLNKKGGIIFRTLNTIVSEPIMETALKNFVHNWKYKNFEPSNFWEELTNVPNNVTLPSGIEIKDIVNLWTTQKGYPLITVTGNYENGSVTLKQYRFTEDQSPSNNLWIIPLSYTTNSQASNDIVWLEDTAPKVIENTVTKGNTSWIYFNSNGASLYRVNYDLDNWNSLISLLKSNLPVLPATHRAQLLDDAFHLARSGLLNYTVALDMSLYLINNEEDILPWTTVFDNMEYLNLMLSKTPNYGSFEDYLIKLLEPIYKMVNSSIDSDATYTQAKLRKLILSWTCKLNYEPCRDWAYSQFHKWEASPGDFNLDKDLLSTVFCVGVQSRGRSAWELLWKRYSEVKNEPGEIRALIKGMSCATEPWLIMKFLHRAIEEESMQNSIMMWNALSSEITIDSAFVFLKDNWNKVFNKYQHSPAAMKQILSAVLSQLTTKYDLDQMMIWFSKHKSDLQMYAQDIISIVTKINQMINWKEKYLENFNYWIENDFNDYIKTIP